MRIIENLTALTITTLSGTTHHFPAVCIDVEECKTRVGNAGPIAFYEDPYEGDEGTILAVYKGFAYNTEDCDTPDLS